MTDKEFKNKLNKLDNNIKVLKGCKKVNEEIQSSIHMTNILRGNK
jgi:hypothetical protein